MLALPRLLAAIVSVLVLAAAAYLLWSWYDGFWWRDADGGLIHERADWRLAVGAILLALCFVGRLLTPMLVAKATGPAPMSRRADGRRIQGRSGASLWVEQTAARQGPILLFTHGWGMDSTLWNLIRARLEPRFQVVVWDLPGLGRSKVAKGARPSLEGFAADLAGLAEGFGRPVILVGHSIGGMTVQTLVRDHPETLRSVAGLALLNTTYTDPLRTMIFARLLTALQKPLLEPATHLMAWLGPLVWVSKWQSYLSGATHLAMRVGFGPAVTRAQLEHASLLATKAAPSIEAWGDLAMFRWDATNALSSIDTPVLIIGGARDIVTKLEASHAMAEQAGGAFELCVVADANHMGPMDEAALYADALARFAESLEPLRQPSRPEALAAIPL